MIYSWRRSAGQRCNGDGFLKNSQKTQVRAAEKRGCIDLIYRVKRGRFFQSCRLAIGSASKTKNYKRKSIISMAGDSRGRFNSFL
jgi:hypothetical protein